MQIHSRPGFARNRKPRITVFICILDYSRVWPVTGSCAICVRRELRVLCIIHCLYCQVYIVQYAFQDADGSVMYSQRRTDIYIYKRPNYIFKDRANHLQQTKKTQGQCQKQRVTLTQGNTLLTRIRQFMIHWAQIGTKHRWRLNTLNSSPNCTFNNIFRVTILPKKYYECFPFRNEAYKENMSSRSFRELGRRLSYK